MTVIINSFIIYILAIVICIIINLILGLCMKKIAIDKGYLDRATLAFVLTLFFGIFGCIYVASMPDLILREQNSKIIDLLSKSNTPKSDFAKPAASTAPMQPKATTAPAQKYEPETKNDMIVCPKCGKMQNSGRTKCWECGAEFK